jgi:hypothetical protein
MEYDGGREKGSKRRGSERTLPSVSRLESQPAESESRPFEYRLESEGQRERVGEGESEQTLSGVSKCKSQLTDSKSRPFD